MTALPLADSERVRVGDLAVAIGNPFRLAQTATAGIVSAVDRQIDAPNGFSIPDAIQTDAAINPGNSGGPLLNERGGVIGVNSQIETGGAGRGNVGIGFAVPANTVREVIPRLKTGDTIARPWLGVETSDSTNPGAPSGAEVQGVTAGSPADGAGLTPGDVITQIDGQPVSGADDVSKIINGKQPGDHVEMRIDRSGQDIKLGANLGNRPTKTP